MLARSVDNRFRLDIFVDMKSLLRNLYLNVRPHPARYEQHYLEQLENNWMVWLTSSSDLNVIEILYNTIGRTLQEE